MPRQSDLANAAEMHQSRISMFETPGANPTIGTLSAIAAALRVGLKIEFVPFSEMLDWENSFSQEQFAVTKIDDDGLFLNPPADGVPQPLPVAVANIDQYNARLISAGEDIWSEVITIPLYEPSLSVHSPTPNVVITTGQILNDEWSRCRWQNEINLTPQISQSLMLTQSD
jgi:transcriptional regulator with XRE-family HTH domain